MASQRAGRQRENELKRLEKQRRIQDAKDNEAQQLREQQERFAAKERQAQQQRANFDFRREMGKRERAASAQERMAKIQNAQVQGEMHQKSIKDDMLRQQHEADERLRRLAIEKEAERLERQRGAAEKDRQRKELRGRVDAIDKQHRDQLEHDREL